MPTTLKPNDAIEIFQSAENELFYIRITRIPEAGLSVSPTFTYANTIQDEKFGLFRDNTIYGSKKTIIGLAKELKTKIERLNVGDIKLYVHI